MALAVLFALFPTLAAFKGVPPDGHSGPPYLFACAVAFLFWYLTIRGMRNVISGKVETIRIDTAGIRFRETFIPWSRVTDIGFSRDSFSHNGSIAFSTHPQRTIRTPMPADARLSREQYGQFVNHLAPWLGENYNHVRIELPPIEYDPPLTH